MPNRLLYNSMRKRKICNCQCGCREEHKVSTQKCRLCYKQTYKYGVCQGRQNRPQGSDPLDWELQDDKLDFIPMTGCWFSWSSPEKRVPYPRTSKSGGGMMRLCKAVLEKKIGRPLKTIGYPKEEREETRHLCHNVQCVNPDHLIVGSHIQNIGDSMRDNRILKGENHPSVKLSDADIVNIRQAYVSGNKTQREIAKDFGVANQHISAIVNFKERKDVRYPVWSQEQQQVFRGNLYA